MEPRNEFSSIRVNVDDMASFKEVSESEKMGAMMRMTRFGTSVVKRVAKMNVAMTNLRCSPVPQKVIYQKKQK